MLLLALLRYELDKAWIADDALGLTVAWPAGGLIVGALEVPLFVISGDTPDGWGVVGVGTGCVRSMPMGLEMEIEDPVRTGEP